MKYFNDVHNRLFKEQEDGSILEVFSNRTMSEIGVYYVETADVQSYLTDSILIFMSRRDRVKYRIESKSMPTYYGDVRKLDVLNNKIKRANAELKAI